MRWAILTLTFAMACAPVVAADAKSKTAGRLDDSASLFSEIMGTPDRSIPQDLLGTSQASGQYYLAATTTDLGSQFERIQKDISSQYVLRWATLKRATVPAYPVNGFQPSFQITYGGFTASWNTTIVTTNVVDDPGPPVVSHNTNVVQF